MVRQPSYSRIVVQDGPSVLGYERFREQEERSTFAYVLDIVRAVLDAGEWKVDAEMEHTFARIFFGAMSSSGAAVSTADDADTEAERVELAIGFILSGLRSLSEQGAPMLGRVGRLLLEGDVPAVDRDQLDPGVTGGHLQLLRPSWWSA